MLDKASPRVLLVIGRSQVGNTISPPTGLYKLQHYLKQRGFACDVLCQDLSDIEHALTLTRHGVYDIIGYSLSHWSLQDDLDTLWQFRDAADTLEKPVLFIGGGQEAAMNAEQCLRVGIDLIFLGFAESILQRFCQRYHEQAYDDRQVSVEEMVGDLPGVVFLDRHDKIVFREAEPISPAYFEEISYTQTLTMDVPYRNYWKVLRDKQSDTSLGSAFVFEFVRLYTASHCPRRCGFCNSQSFLPISQGCQPKIIHLNAGQIVDLILHFTRRHGARGFFFSDDDFPIGNRSGIERVEQLCDMIIEQKACGKIHPTVRFSCQARIADFLMRKTDGSRRVNVALLETMASAGFSSIAMGVETFSDRLLKVPSINKIGVNARNCFDVLDAMLKAGLTPLINIILGIPEATVKELLETLRIAVYYVTQGCEINVTGPLYALPGAPLMDDERYRIAYREWSHPRSGERIEISDYFVPDDARVAEVSANYETQLEQQLLQLAEKHDWQGKIIHKRAKNIQAIIVATKLLGDHKLAAQFEEILEAMIDHRLTPSMGQALLPPIMQSHNIFNTRTLPASVSM